MFKCNISYTLILYFILCYYAGHYCYSLDKYEGSQCNNGDGRPGICTLLTDCNYAIQALRRKHHHNLERCGFKFSTEIVCCPIENQIDDENNNNNNNNDTSGNRIWTDDPVVDIVTTPKYPISDNASPRSPLILRKSAEACNEYSNEVKISLSFHIVDGEDVERGEFPHMAALGYLSDNGDIEYLCGASLISNQYVITAAHCIVNTRRILPTTVRLGDINLSKNVQEPAKQYDIFNITVHPKFKWKEKFNDIALIKLKNTVEYSQYIYPACLYNKPDEPTGLIICGWGDTTLGGDKSDILQKAKLSPVSLPECNTTYQERTTKRIVSSQICAVDNKSDACQGDSGGPLQVQIKKGSSIYSIVGITSYGIGCGSKYPGVYTRIYSYLDWIENIVWP